MGSQMRGALCILLVTISLFIFPAVIRGQGLGDGDCTSGADQTTFTCTNTNTIPCSMVDDGINDCGDNSDEGYLDDCEVIDGIYQFKCTMEGQLDYNQFFSFCVRADLVGDTHDDCPDRSDEQKILGDACLGTDEDLESRIGCWYFMTESYCNSTNQCDCQSGRKPVSRNSDCQVRVRTDDCVTQADCEDAYYGLFCNDSMMCDCKVGFYVDDMDITNCIGNRLYENCTVDLECSNPIENAECDSDWEVCVCNSLYIANHTTNYSCDARVIGDPCTYNAQCLTGMSNAECVNDECVCKDGAYANDDGTDCIKRLVGEACASNSECDLIRYGKCKNDECDCESNSLLVDHLDNNCALGIGDLYCESDDNCTSQISKSYCTPDNICMCEFGYYAETHKKCAKRILGTQNCRNNTDCNEAIDNSVCKSDGSCQCANGYAPDPDSTSGKECISEEDAACRDFACRYPWAIALLVIGLLAIAAVVIVLIIKKPWKKPTGSETADKPVKPHTVVPVSNGGPIDPESAKPMWTLRPKSGIPSMYGSDVRMQEAKDPETDAFYNGGKKKKAMTPVDGDVFIFKGETGELHAAQLAAANSNVHDDGFHRCDYVLPDGTKCEFSTDSYYRMRIHKKEYEHFIRDKWPKKKSKKRKSVRPNTMEGNVQPLDNIQEEPGTAWVSEDDDATLAALSETGLRTSSDQPYQQTTLQTIPNGTNRHIALAFASMEEPMDTEENSQLFSEDDFDMRGHNDSRAVFSDGIASVTGVELNNSAINEVARVNSTMEMVDEKAEEGDEEGGKKGKKGKGKKGKGDKGKKEKKGKKGKDGEKKGKGKKEKGEKKEKKGKKKGEKGKKNKNNNNRNCEGNDTLLDSTLESVSDIFNAAEQDANRREASRRHAPAQPASRAPAAQQWIAGFDDMDDVDPMAFSRANENRHAPVAVHRPESRCSMRSPVDTVVLPVPGYVRDERDSHSMYDIPRRNGPRW